MRWLPVVIAAPLLVLLWAAPAAAHFGGQALVFVPEREILPGGRFTVVAADLAPNTSVALELRNEEYSTSLGGAPAGHDGHFQTTLTMPSDVPLGFIELIATSPDGTRASTWIRVGAVADAGSTGSLDPSMVMLGALVLGSAGAVGYVLLRGRAAAQQPVAADGPRRQRVARKARRRART
jgi:hypothetical protein